MSTVKIMCLDNFAVYILLTNWHKTAIYSSIAIFNRNEEWVTPITAYACELSNGANLFVKYQ